MNFATILRLTDLKRNDGWDFRYTIPYFWKLMADKLNIGLFAVMSDSNFEKDKSAEHKIFENFIKMCDVTER